MNTVLPSVTSWKLSVFSSMAVADDAAATRARKNDAGLIIVMEGFAILEGKGWYVVSAWRWCYCAMMKRRNIMKCVGRSAKAGTNQEVLPRDFVDVRKTVLILGTTARVSISTSNER